MTWGRPDDEEILSGGVANAGLVVRVGDEVRRPANARTPTVHVFLRRLHASGFDGVPRPVGSPAIDAEGRERLAFIPGEVPLPPYPSWVQTDAALASVARLLRRFHDATRLCVTGPAGSRDLWSDELADPWSGPGDEILVCHNDVCLENVVFRDGEAVALLDLDFAAPGRATYDLAQLARMCAPVDDPLSAQRLGWLPADVAARLRVVADAYGLQQGRGELVQILDASIARGGDFVRRHVDAGEPGFVAMWLEIGGMARFDRRRAWFAEMRETLERDL